jgi:folate-binding protein YgfZ
MSDDAPRAALDRRLGGRLGVHGGGEVVADYGDPDGEYRALAGGVGLLDRSRTARLELSGPDRQRFLGGLVTCEVKGLAPGEGAYGFFPGPQGKILADAVILALADRLWLELPPGLGGEIAAHLRKYVITDQVEVRELGAEVLPLALAGPGAAALVASWAEPPAGRWHHRPATVAGAEVEVQRRPLAGVEAFTLWAPAAAAAAVAEALLAAGGVPVGFDAYERLRVENGVPAFGRDFGRDHFPQESGLEEQAVSYTKGCYLGQEVIARIHYRGRANRAARRLLFSSASPPPAGSRLLYEGEEVGSVGSAVASTQFGHAVGIAVLHRKANAPGTRLEVEGGGEAEVAALPPDPF